jgi:hypothetical protein
LLTDYQWRLPWAHPRLTLDFIHSFHKRIDWTVLCENPVVPGSFLSSYIDLVDWKSLCCNTGLHSSFFFKWAKELKKMNTHMGGKLVELLKKNPSVPIEVVAPLKGFKEFKE